MQQCARLPPAAPTERSEASTIEMRYQNPMHQCARLPPAAPTQRGEASIIELRNQNPMHQFRPPFQQSKTVRGR
jgi:hypothetical protein